MVSGYFSVSVVWHPSSVVDFWYPQDVKRESYTLPKHILSYQSVSALGYVNTYLKIIRQHNYRSVGAVCEAETLATSIL